MIAHSATWVTSRAHARIVDVGVAADDGLLAQSIALSDEYDKFADTTISLSQECGLLEASLMDCPRWIGEQAARTPKRRGEDEGGL